MTIRIEPFQDFHVVMNDKVKVLSLRDLEAAYQLAEIRGDTLVWQPSLRDWKRLDTLPLELKSPEEAEKTEEWEPISEEIDDEPTEQIHNLSLSDIELPPARYFLGLSTWYGRSLTFLMIFSLLLILHRNGYSEKFAEQWGRRQLLGRIELTIGSPTVNTPHGLERWLRNLSIAHGLGALSPTTRTITIDSTSRLKPGVESARVQSARVQSAQVERTQELDTKL